MRVFSSFSCSLFIGFRQFCATALLLAVLTGFNPLPAEGSALEAPEETRETMLEEVKRLAEMTSAATGFSAFDQNILEALAQTPREDFLSAAFKNQPYSNRFFRVGYGHWLNSPFISALGLQLLNLEAGDKVLVADMGAGYETSLLAHMGLRVYALEETPALLTVATSRARHLGHENVNSRPGSPADGWQGAAPFDAILLLEAQIDFDDRILDQLAPGGRLVTLIGPDPFDAQVVVITKTLTGAIEVKPVLPTKLQIDRHEEPI